MSLAVAALLAQGPTTIRDAACVADSSFEKLTRGRGRGQEDRSSFYRRGAIGDWREHFDEEAIEAFAAKAGDLLIQLGYEPSAATAET